MKKLVIYSFTEAGSILNEKLLEIFRRKEYLCEGYTTKRVVKGRHLREIPENWKETLGENWGKQAIIFIGASGIAVRAISPFVKDKFSDPPVVVMDEKGKFVIPLLSGHVGGAVELASMISEETGALPVVTTATDVNEKFAVDVFARKNHLVITDRIKAKRVSAAILEGKRIGVFSEFPITDKLPEELSFCETEKALRHTDMGICICQRMPKAYECDTNILYLLSQNLYVGIGCRKGVSRELLEIELGKVLEKNGFVKKQICALGSIDLKKEEALIQLAEILDVPFDTFSAEELKTVQKVSGSSAFVKQITGVDNVCERAGRMLCPEGVMVQKKICMDKCTAAIVQGKMDIQFQS